MSYINKIITKSHFWRSLPKLPGHMIFMMLGLHGWLLVFRIPHTLRNLFKAFRPGGHGVADDDFWAFGRTDAGFRPWYNKVARDHRTQGRFGYVWDDGLGMPMGPVLFNNWVTYKILSWLGTRRMTAIGYLLIVISSAGLCGWYFGVWAGVVAGLLLAGSPTIAACYTHLGKTEVLWWGFVPFFVYAAFSGKGLLAGLLWSLLACSNLGVSVLLVLMLGPALLFFSLSTNFFFWLLIGVMPGAVKHAIRVIYMWRSGFFSDIVSEQSHLWKWPWRPISFELGWWLPFILSVTASAFKSQQFITGGLIMVVCLLLIWGNRRFIQLIDVQGFHLAFFTIGFGYAIAVQSLLGLIAIILFAYCHPPWWYEGVWKQCWPNWRKAWQMIKSYLDVAPIPLLQPSLLITFLNQIPDGTRFLAESDGDPRTGSRFRVFWQWAEEFLPHRQVDLVNEIQTRFVEPELVVRYLTNFNASKMNAQTMGQICQVLGVSHVVAFSPATVNALKTIGYQEIAQVDLRQLDQQSRNVIRPPGAMALLRASSPQTVIDPAVRWERKGNVLSWKAKAGQSYVIRYRYHPNFRAYQNGQRLNVEPVRPFMELPLTFMRVEAIADGPIALKFTKFFTRKFADMVFCEASNTLNHAAKGHTLNQQGEEKFTNGDIEGALDAFTKAIEVAPDFATPHNNLGVLYWQRGDVEKSLKLFVKAMEIDPDDRDTVLNCADASRSLGMLENAKEIYSSYLERNPNDEVIASTLENLTRNAKDAREQSESGLNGNRHEIY